MNNRNVESCVDFKEPPGMLLGMPIKEIINGTSSECVSLDPQRVGAPHHRQDVVANLYAPIDFEREEGNANRSHDDDGVR
jgi:hypothetical protein